MKTEYKIYLPVKHKTNIKGYWIDNGKIYKDNLTDNTLTINTPDNSILRYLCIEHKQLAIFYTDSNNRAYVYDNRKNRTDILKSFVIHYHRGFKGLKGKIKGLLDIYGGVTVYKIDGLYKIVCYY